MANGDLKPGALIAGQFRMNRCLGRGTLGTVYQVRDQFTDQWLALKMIRGPLLRDHSLEEQLLRNIEKARELRNPGIAPIFDARRDGQSLFYTMPYLEGHTLRQFLGRHGALSFRNAVGLLCRISLILEYGHRLMPHKSLCPENIMVFPDASVVLMDYGLLPESCPRDELPSNRCYYTAPEERSGEPATVSGDVYSLAAVLFETLAGEPPAGYGRLSDLQPAAAGDMDEVMARALGSAEKRYRSARAFRKAVERCAPARGGEAAAKPEALEGRHAAAEGARPKLVHSSQERAWHEWELELERTRVQEVPPKTHPESDTPRGRMRDLWRKSP